MTQKTTPFKLEAHAEKLLSAEMVKQAEEAFKTKSVDNSPQLDALLFRDLLEQVSALNLCNLANEFTTWCNESPLLNEATYQRPLDMTREGFLMAVAFETGRRYNLLQALALLTGEVEALPEEASPTTESIVLEG
jgi:alpha-D-ribose 1-methylphosphonate 5-triphosphate synthase subunit PhnI